MSDGTIRVGRRELTISHPDKRLFADPPITKLELARHYERVAGAMVPLVRDRPLALQAFPDGIEGKGFFMKSVPKYFPDWIATATVPKRGGTLTQVLADDAATLVYLAGQNVVTPHVWLSRADEPQIARPVDHRLRSVARACDFAEIRAAARDAGERLRDAGLATYAMVTGSRGIHVVCPLRRGPDFTEVHAFARALAERMVADDPRNLTLEWHRDERGARIYIDVNRDRLRPARRRSLRASGPGRARRWRCRSPGTSCRTARSRPTAGRSGPRPIASTPRATRGPGSAAMPGGCRRSPTDPTAPAGGNVRRGNVRGRSQHRQPPVPSPRPTGRCSPPTPSATGASSCCAPRSSTAG